MHLATNNFILIKVDGNRTVQENVADNGALKVAYLAYRQWLRDNDIVDEDRLPGLEFLLPTQMFWLNYAQQMCSIPSNGKNRLIYVGGDDHILLLKIL